MNHHGIEAQYPFKCITPIQLRFNDVDALGHINNSVYFELLDLAKTRYFTDLQVEKEIDWRKPSLVVANINCSFLAPTFFNESLEVLTQCARLGNKSLTLLQHLVNKDTREVKCTCATVMVNIASTTVLPSPLPKVWRDAIIAFEGHEFVSM